MPVNINLAGVASRVIVVGKLGEKQPDQLTIFQTLGDPNLNADTIFDELAPTDQSVGVLDKRNLFFQALSPVPPPTGNTPESPKAFAEAVARRIVINLDLLLEYLASFQASVSDAAYAGNFHGDFPAGFLNRCLLRAFDECTDKHIDEVLSADNSLDERNREALKKIVQSHCTEKKTEDARASFMELKTFFKSKRINQIISLLAFEQLRETGRSTWVEALKPQQNHNDPSSRTYKNQELRWLWSLLNQKLHENFSGLDVQDSLNNFLATKASEHVKKLPTRVDTTNRERLFNLGSKTFIEEARNNTATKLLDTATEQRLRDDFKALHFPILMGEPVHAKDELIDRIVLLLKLVGTPDEKWVKASDTATRKFRSHQKKVQDLIEKGESPDQDVVNASREGAREYVEAIQEADKKATMIQIAGLGILNEGWSIGLYELVSILLPAEKNAGGHGEVSLKKDNDPGVKLIIKSVSGIHDRAAHSQESSNAATEAQDQEDENECDAQESAHDTAAARDSDTVDRSTSDMASGQATNDPRSSVPGDPLSVSKGTTGGSDKTETKTANSKQVIDQHSDSACDAEETKHQNASENTGSNRPLNPENESSSSDGAIPPNAKDPNISSSAAGKHAGDDKTRSANSASSANETSTNAHQPHDWRKNIANLLHDLKVPGEGSTASVFDGSKAIECRMLLAEALHDALNAKDVRLSLSNASSGRADEKKANEKEMAEEKEKAELRLSRLRELYAGLILCLFHEEVGIGKQGSEKLKFLLALIAANGDTVGLLREKGLHDYFVLNNVDDLDKLSREVRDAVSDLRLSLSSKLSDLYGLRELFQSTCPKQGVQVGVFNGAAQKFLEHYKNELYSPLTVGNDGNRIPLAIYFSDSAFTNHQDKVDFLSNRIPKTGVVTLDNGQKHPLPICLVGWGPDWETGETFPAESPPHTIPPYVHLVGPGLRYRGLNDGSGKIPLIPSAYALLAALLGGDPFSISMQPLNQTQNGQQTASSSARTSLPFPHQNLIAPKEIRFKFLHSGTNQTNQNPVNFAKMFLEREEDSLFYDVTAWFAILSVFSSSENSVRQERISELATADATMNWPFSSVDPKKFNLMLSSHKKLVVKLKHLALQNNSGNDISNSVPSLNSRVGQWLNNLLS